MKGKVIRFCDLTDIQIPVEKCSVSVDPAQVTEAVDQLSVRYADKTWVQRAENGDVVYCRADEKSYPDGRDIILYTGLELPGAEAAAEAAIGREIGEKFDAPIGEKTVMLTVQKIIRMVPVSVNDALVASIGIGNVSTVEDYRNYIQNKMLEDQKKETIKQIVGEVTRAMMEKSTFAYDESEAEDYLKAHMDEIKVEYAQYGMEISEDEIRMGIIDQSKQGWLAEAYCQKHGIEIDRESIESETDQMMEMMTVMGEDVPDRETMLEETLYNNYMMVLFEHVEKAIKEKMEG